MSSSSNSNARPPRNRLGQAISSALVLGAIAAPNAGAQSFATAGLTADEASEARKAEYARRLPDLGSETARPRSPDNERLLGEALAFLSSGQSTDALVDRAANAALDHGVDALRAAGVPFLGSLQGGIVYNSTLDRVDFDLLTMVPVAGEGPGSHWLLQLGAHNLRDRATANAGLVYRWLDPEGQYLLGANAFYDHDFHAGAKRLGVGGEAANDTLRAFANAYAPLGGWADVREDAKLEERPARGFDFGVAWTPRELSMLDLQLKGSKWKGNGVDVFGNGRTEIDPTVWSAKATLTPAQALRLGLEHSQVAGGPKDFQVMAHWIYQFGVPLSQQWAPTGSGARNDLRLRLLSPVEREKRIVMDTREKRDPPMFPNGALAATVVEGQLFTHLLDVAGGTFPLTFSLAGPDASRFFLDGTSLHLPAQRFDAPTDTGFDNTYDVTVVVIDKRGRQATQQVAVTVETATPTARNARIDGTPQVGMPLALGYDYFSPLDEAEDLDGRRIQWFRRGEHAQGDMDIAGATGMGYVPVAADEGYVIGARVSVRSDSGRTGAFVEALGDVVQASGAPTANPSIQGTLVVGATLTGLVGFADADGDAEGTHLYQWYRSATADGADAVGILGATSATYVVDAADADHYLVFEVTPKSLSGTPDVGAPARVVTRIAISSGGHAPTATPSLQGVATIGSTLVGDVGYFDADGDAPGNHVYRWYRATDAAGEDRTPIPGAFDASYTAVADDVGKYLVFEVIPRSVNGSAPNVGTAARVVSDLVGDDHLPTTSPAVSLAGARVVGNAVLTAVPNYADADGDAEGTHVYQWYRADDAAGTNRVPVANATAATYTPIPVDQGKHLTVEVTPRTASGTSGELRRSSNGVAIPYGEWRYQEVVRSAAGYTLRDIVVAGRTGAARRIRVEIGRADEEGPYSAFTFWAGVDGPGQQPHSLINDIANGETRSAEWTYGNLADGGNGTWTIYMDPNGPGLNGVYGAINYATVEFLDDEE